MDELNHRVPRRPNDDGAVTILELLLVLAMYTTTIALMDIVQAKDYSGWWIPVVWFGLGTLTFIAWPAYRWPLSTDPTKGDPPRTRKPPTVRAFVPEISHS